MVQNLRDDARGNVVQEPAMEDPTFDLPWYRWWVFEQIRKQPEHLLLGLPDCGPYTDSSMTLETLWNQIRKDILAGDSRSIDSITDMVISRKLVNIEDSYEATMSVKELVFSIIGLQTMLYQPYFDPGPPGGYQILSEMNGYRGTTRMSLYQSSDSGTRDLPEFLLGFGMMLPPPNYCTHDNDDDRQVFNKTKMITPSDIDAYALSRLCGVKFQWVDSLSCHLELDKPSSTLFIYRYPSFCVSCLQQREIQNGKEGQKSVLHSCAVGRSEHLLWANEEDVNKLLQEILLSYRVIFGQNKRSRNVFRKLRPFASVPKQGQDQSLAEICGRKRFTCPFMPAEQEEYDLVTDFPHLRNKMAQLNDFASRKRPRSLRHLWKDRRDSPAWLAYWSALIFGLIGLLLVFIQTVLQVLQYVESVRDGGNGN